MFPVEILARIGHHLHGDHYLNLLFTSKLSMNGMILHETLPYKLSNFQEKAYRELLSSKEQSLMYLSFVETDSYKVLINYMYRYLKREDGRILILCGKNRGFRGILKFFEDNLAITDNSFSLIKERKIILSSRFNNEIVSIFRPTLIIAMPEYSEEYKHLRYDTYIPSKRQYIEWSHRLINLPYGPPPIVQKSHIPFPSYTHRCLVERSPERGIAHMIKLHSKFTILGGTKALIKYLRKECSFVFSSHEREAYEESTQGILVYCIEDKPKNLSGVVFLHPHSENVLQYATLSSSITLLYHQKIQFTASYQDFSIPFIILCDGIGSLLNAYAYPIGSYVRDNMVLSDRYYDTMNQLMTVKRENGISIFEWNSRDCLELYVKEYAKEIHSQVLLEFLNNDKIII